MLPNGRRVLGIALLVVATAAAIWILRSSGTKGAAVEAAEQGLQTAELERQAAAARAAVVVTRAAEARAATKPVLARAEELRSRVTVERTGKLRVHDTGVEEKVVPVPPLVTERIQADSAAISALSLALTLDAQAAAAQEKRLFAEAKARDAALLTITSLEQERRPRCGRRCGMLLGAASIVALGIAVDQTKRLLYH